MSGSASGPLPASRLTSALSDRPDTVAVRLDECWIAARGAFGWSLARALGTSMAMPVLVGLVAAVAAPATAALLESVVDHGGPTAPSAGLAVGLCAAVLVQRAASWASTVLLRRRCELATSAVSRCLARRAMATTGLDEALSVNLVVARYPEILAQYVFVAGLPGHLLAVGALFVVAVSTAGPVGAGAALGAVAVVLAVGYALDAREARAAYEVERCEAGRTRLMATTLTARATLTRQCLGRQVMASFTAHRGPQTRALRRRTIVHAASVALWSRFELLALLAALLALAVVGRLDTVGPALTLLVIVRLLGAEITAAMSVVSCLQDARPVLHALRTRLLDTTPDRAAATGQRENTVEISPGVRVPRGARAVVLGPVGAGKTRLLHDVATTARHDTRMLIARGSPLPPGTVSTAITLHTDLYGRADKTRYGDALAASGVGRDLIRWGPPGDGRSVGPDDGLSDGERCRIQLAQALYWAPDVLALDDVFAALDRDTASTIAPAVLGPDPATRTVVWTTTRPELAAWADYVVLTTADTVRVLPASEVTPADLAAVVDSLTSRDLEAVMGTASPTARPPAPSPDQPSVPAASTAAPEPARDAHRPAGPAAMSDLVYRPPRWSSLARHGVGLYGRGTALLVTVLAVLAVTAAIAAAQVTDTIDVTGSVSALGALTGLIAAAAALSFGLYALAGTRAVARMTVLQQHVLAGLLRPESATDTSTPPLSRLTTDVHVTEFRASERLLTNVVGVLSAAVFFTATAVTAPVVLWGLLPALVAIAVIVRGARGRRARAQVLAVSTREPLLRHAEAALALSPTVNHPAARSALHHRFSALADDGFRAGRRSLDLRAALLAATEVAAVALFTVTTVAALSTTTTEATALTSATVIYLAYAVTSSLAGVIEQLAQADSLHATLTRVASLTGTTELTVAPRRHTTPARGWATTHATGDPGSLTLTTAPEVELAPGRPVALTGASGAGKSLFLRRAAALGPAEGDARSVALLDADIPPLGLDLAAFLDPDQTRDRGVLERAWKDVHPPGLPPPDLDTTLDPLPHSERQLANLTRAHLHRPDLLLLDESLSALDVAGEAHVITTLVEAFPATATLTALHRRTNVGLFHREITTSELFAHDEAADTDGVAELGSRAERMRPTQRDRTHEA